MVLCTMWPEKNVLNGIFFFSVSHSWAIVLANFLGGLSSAHLYGLMLTQSARQRHDAQQRQQQQQLSSSRGQHFSAVSQSFWCLLFFVCMLLGCAVFFLSFFLVLLILFFLGCWANAWKRKWWIRWGRLCSPVSFAGPASVSFPHCLCWLYTF